MPPIQRALLTLMNFEEHHELLDGDIPADFFSEAAQASMAEIESDRFNIFKPLTITPYLEKLWIPEDPQFRAAILNRSQVHEQIEYVQRLLGKAGRQATTIANELIGDMDRGTDYPPAPLDPPVLAPQVTAKLRDILAAITLKKKEAGEMGDQ